MNDIQTNPPGAAGSAVSAPTGLKVRQSKGLRNVRRVGWNLLPPLTFVANGSGNTAQMVASNQSQVAYADAVTISQMIAKGAPMKVLSTVSTSIFANNTYIKDYPEVVRRFIAASLKGWSFALDNPEKTVKDLKSTFPSMNEKLATAELAAITPLFCSGGAKYIGKAEDALWAKSQDLLSQVKLLPAGQDPKTYYTNDYLPKASEMRACKP